MPNWTTTSVDIQGDASDIQLFKTRFMGGTGIQGAHTALRYLYTLARGGLLYMEKGTPHPWDPELKETSGKRASKEWTEIVRAISDGSKLDLALRLKVIVLDIVMSNKIKHWSSLSKKARASIGEMLGKCYYDWIPERNVDDSTNRVELLFNQLASNCPSRDDSSLTQYGSLEGLSAVSPLAVLRGYNDSAKDYIVGGTDLFNENVERLGTKWSDVEFSMHLEYGRHIRFLMTTAWCVPTEALIAISKELPSLTFNLVFINEGEDSVYRYRFGDGVEGGPIIDMANFTIYSEIVLESDIEDNPGDIPEGEFMVRGPDWMLDSCLPLFLQ